jgi:hypothetical protein
LFVAEAPDLCTVSDLRIGGLGLFVAEAPDLEAAYEIAKLAAKVIKRASPIARNLLTFRELSIFSLLECEK